MGAWSHGTFDNDDAMDWVCELQDADGFEPFEAALEVGDNYLEAPEASIALAAAEVLAALFGKPAANLPEEVTTWLAGKKPPPRALGQKAQRVVQRILDSSELKDLWAESEESALWQQDVEGLLQRRSGASA